MAKEQIKEGPIALLSCVEPCLSFRVRGDHQTKMLRLVMESTKCTHLYHYYQHSEIGRMHIRVQTWFPFSVDVCLNGRQWLARQMDRAGIDYQQRDNCFIWIKDYAAVQELLDEQLRGDWPALMNAFLELAHPLHSQITAPMVGLSYYWSGFPERIRDRCALRSNPGTPKALSEIFMPCDQYFPKSRCVSLPRQKSFSVQWPNTG